MQCPHSFSCGDRHLHTQAVPWFMNVQGRGAFHRYRLSRLSYGGEIGTVATDDLTFDTAPASARAAVQAAQVAEDCFAVSLHRLLRFLTCPMPLDL